MEDQDKILVDANVFVALYHPLDPHHLRALKILNEFKDLRIFYITNNYIISEAATVILLRSKNVTLASSFVEESLERKMGWFKIFQVNKTFQIEAYSIFKKQEKHRGEFLSFADCTLLAQAKRQKIKSIFTFDKVFNDLGKDTIEVLS